MHQGESAEKRKRTLAPFALDQRLIDGRVEACYAFANAAILDH